MIPRLLRAGPLLLLLAAAPAAASDLPSMQLGASTTVGGQAFAPSAFTDATNAANISSGVLPGARLPTTLPSGETIPSPTVTGSFTAPGLVTNGDLANSSTTVNGQVCALGGSCAIAQMAGFRNRLINGAMAIDQRGLSSSAASVTGYISGTTLTVTAVGSGTLVVGQALSATGMT
ncbi:MAG: hypothetical protein WAU78_07840, partial [Roseiarcus sp.]